MFQGAKMLKGHMEVMLHALTRWRLSGSTDSPLSGLHVSRKVEDADRLGVLFGVLYSNVLLGVGVTGMSEKGGSETT